MIKNKIIITGGAGYIGSHTYIALIKAGYVPIIVDNFSNSDKRIINRLNQITKSPPIYIEQDVCNQKAFQELVEKHAPIFGIIHFAADKSVNESITNPLKYYDNNLASLISVLSAVAKFSIPHFVLSSSATVYGANAPQPVSESYPRADATSPYGRTKIICETIVEDMSKVYPKINFTLLRYFNPIGNHYSGIIGDEPRGIPNNLLPYLLRVASGELEELTIYGGDYNTPDGTCHRDFIHVLDLADAHVAALNNTTLKNNLNIYNVGTGISHSVLNVVHVFEKVTGIKVKYRIGPRRPGDVEKIWADPKKIMNELGWRPKYTLEKALADAWKFEQLRRS